MLKPTHRTFGFTMVEVTVAATIFTLTTLGILSMISVLRAPAKTSHERLTSALRGQAILDDLRAKVDQHSWDDPNSPLAPGVHNVSGISYVVTNDHAGGRNVTLTIQVP